ncbi:MAG: hypothetical protein EB127_01525 [Alphaproteobacteria bacterium]|nr:hypothetical protein [Alphaproteobacteria bacterium]
MFESIKSALVKNNTQQSRNKDILKCEVGNTYTVRLIPNTANPSKTFFHYYTFGWTSFSTGQYVSAVSPTSFGERDPIAEARFKILKTGTEEEKAKARSILRSEKWLVNAYIVNDPVNPDNNGKTMVLRYGKQLHKIIMDAIEGEGSEDLGVRIFDLSPNGCNLKVKVEQQGDYPTYVSSKFMMPKAIEGLDETKIKDLYKNVIDLESIFTVKSYEELKTMLDEHYYGGESQSPAPAAKSVAKAKPAPVAVTTESSNEDPLEDDTVKKLLEGLD